MFHNDIYPFFISLFLCLCEYRGAVSCQCILSAAVYALLVPVCTSACMSASACVRVWGGCYQSRWGGGGGWRLSIISFNYPEHSERPKLTPLLSSGCWKSHAYFTTRRPIVCHSGLLLSSDKTRLITVIYRTASLPFSCLSTASMLSVWKTKEWIINIRTVHIRLSWSMLACWKKTKCESQVSPSLVCLCWCLFVCMHVQSCVMCVSLLLYEKQ